MNPGSAALKAASVEEAKGLDMSESLPNVTVRAMCQARCGVRRLHAAAGSRHQKRHLAECTVAVKVSAHESMCSCQQAGAQQHVCQCRARGLVESASAYSHVGII